MISQGLSGGPGFYIGTNFAGNIRAGDLFSTGVPFGSVGSLTHYAVVFDAIAATSKLYVNGAVVASLSSAISAGAAGTNTRFGRQFDPFNEYFNGLLDDVRVYSGALTAQEVALLAVPEPETYILLAVGLVLIGAHARRSKT